MRSNMIYPKYFQKDKISLNVRMNFQPNDVNREKLSVNVLVTRNAKKLVDSAVRSESTRTNELRLFLSQYNYVIFHYLIMT